MSARGVSDIERGLHPRPQRWTLVLLAKALHLDPAQRAALEQAGRGYRCPITDRAETSPSTRVRSPSPSIINADIPSQCGHNLSLPMSSFVGRSRDIAAISRALESSRLVTVSGPGGSGKSRLAAQVAVDRLAIYPGGAWRVDLAALMTPERLTHAIASALRISDSPEESPELSLRRFLSARPTLLVLDNCEHVIADSACLVHELLQWCPNLVILATSRETLRIVGEVTYRLPALSFPDDVPDHVADLLRFEAVELFVERARAVQPDFVLTPRDAVAVTEICRRLDGIPLAIELAAARVRHLRPTEIARRISDRFGLLTGGSRTALPRSQSLRASVRWSYDLLTKDEQALFRRLAIFPGSFALPETERVWAASDPREQVGSDEVLDLLTRLMDQSLRQADLSGNEVRFRLLETMRAYAWEQLVEAGEEAQVRHTYRAWFGETATTFEAVPSPHPGPSTTSIASSSRWPTHTRHSTGGLNLMQSAVNNSPGMYSGSARLTTTSREAAG